MANLTITLTGTRSEKAIEIEAGETINVGLTWLNADGSPRDMTSASLMATVYRKSGTAWVKMVDISQPDAYTLFIPAATTDSWAPGNYHCELTETRTPYVNIGSFSIAVIP